jgi:hypothetical protein
MHTRGEFDAALALRRGMAPARDNKQWKQACREVGLDRDEEKLASDDFHAEKKAFGDRRHWRYGNLTIWLRNWKDDRWRS